MKKSTKGAVAAASAAVLLMGGAGSLAFWSDTQSVDGSTVTAGEMSLAKPKCDPWKLDTHEDASGAIFDPTKDKLVPGDVLTRDCTAKVTAVGNHLRATVTASAPTLSGANKDAFTVTATGLTIGNVAAPEFTEDANGKDLKTTVTVTFKSASGNGTQKLAATLDDITLVATQVHGPTATPTPVA